MRAHQRCMHPLALPLFLLASLPLTHAFSFSNTVPSSCDPLTLTWSGGTPPFTLLITPAFSSVRTIPVPASAFSTTTTSGNFSTQLDVAPSQPFLLTMSDATGFNTGGTSGVLYATPSISNTQCNTSGPANVFDFDLLPASPVQCESQVISWTSTAIQPIQLTGLIPLGDAIEITADGITNTQSGEASYAWTVNVAADSSFIFFATDADGHVGGSSNLLTVGASSNSSCINSLSPSSTVSTQPSQTGSTSLSSSPSASIPPSPNASSSSSSNSSSNISSAAILGASIGGAIVLMTLLALIIFWCRRRWRSSTLGFSGGRSLMPVGMGMSTGMIDLLPRSNSPHESTYSTTQYEPVPFIVEREHHVRTASDEPFLSTGPTDLKGREARPAPNVVMHEDAGSVYGSGSEDAGDEYGEPETVELPPAYGAVLSGRSRAGRGASGSREPEAVGL